MIGPGFAYLWIDKSDVRHLWFVLSSPTIDPDYVVTVNVSTFNPKKDQSCILEPGEHGFVTVKSCVMYDEAEFRTLYELEQMIASNTIIPHEPANAALFDKLLEGAYATRRMPAKFKTILSNQGVL